MQAIKTTFRAPNNHRPTRILASCAAGRVEISWDYGLTTEQNHSAAAEKLREKLGWAKENYGRLHTGQLNVDCFVHVFAK